MPKGSMTENTTAQQTYNEQTPPEGAHPHRVKTMLNDAYLSGTVTSDGK